MWTHLDRMESEERWNVWRSPPFLDVSALVPGHVDRHAVPLHVRARADRRAEPPLLSRWDVHEMLSTATDEAFAAPPAAARTERVRVFRWRGGEEEVDVVRPADAREWITEIGAARRATAHRYYRAGEWIVELEPGSLWANIHGATQRGAASAYSAQHHGMSSYRDMIASATPRRWASALGALMNGGAGDGSWMFAQTARLAAAVFISESARNFRNWGASWMLHDLMPERLLEVIGDDRHPMARGGTFRSGPTGMGGGRADRATWAFETGIAMRWLISFHFAFAHEDEGDRRFRDPVRREPYVNQVRRTLRGAMLHRIQGPGDLTARRA